MAKIAQAEVQSIDLGAPPNGREALVETLDASFSSTGLVFVRMTEAQRASKDRALDAVRAFFNLPEEEKLRVQAPQGAGNACLRGYVPYGSKLQRSADVDSSTAVSNALEDSRRVPDRKESFTVGVHTFCDSETRSAEAGDVEYFDEESADGRLFAENRWPSGVVGAELRAAWRAYFEQSMEPLVRMLYELIAEALQIDAAVFEAAHRRHFSECRCNHYLACDDSEEGSASPPLLAGQRRMSPHTDFTDFTILAPDPAARYPHLQVAGRDGAFRVVPFAEDSLTVLLGEPMEKWSNGRWLAPLHFVDAPAAAAEKGAKLTLVYFRNPDYSTVIAPSRSCPARRYPDVTVGEHWWGMYARSKSAFGVAFQVQEPSAA